MSRVSFRPPEAGDAEAIAAGMREMDARECAAFGHTPRSGLSWSLAQSSMAWIAETQEGPFAAFGVTPIDWMAGEGSPWMLGTAEVGRHAREMLVAPRRYLRLMQQTFPRLANFVHAENAPSRLWLERLGFAVDGELRHIGGEPMLRFSKGF